MKTKKTKKKTNKKENKNRKKIKAINKNKKNHLTISCDARSYNSDCSLTHVLQAPKT